MVIYSALTIGFFFLLTLIWLIGSRGVEELQNISVQANENADDFQLRLLLAAKIREESINVVAQAKVMRTSRDRRVPIFPFGFTLNEAKQNFGKTLEAGRRLWNPRAELQALKPEELKAWRDVESAAPEFLASIEDLTLAKEGETAGEQSASAGNDNANQVTDQNLFWEARKNLDAAVGRLSRAIIQDQFLIFNRIRDDQLQAANRVSQTRWNAIIVGVFVTFAVFLMTRNHFAKLRRAVRSARNAQDFARSVFDSQSNDILVIAENGELSAVNQAFFKHFKLKQSELALQDYRGAFAHLPEVSEFIRKTLQFSDKDASHRDRIEVKPKRGLRQSQNFPAETRLFDVYVSPLTIDRETHGRVVVLVDVTEEEQVREELRRNRTLSAVGQITAQVAHELYNPIGAVKLNIELLEMQMSGSDDDDLKHTVARLKRGAEHLSTIVLDLRYLTRPRDPERKPTNLNKLLDEVVELASDRLERNRTVIVRHYAADIPLGNFDSQQLRKVFLNLLINAVEASPANAEVELHTTFVASAAAILPDVEAARGALAVSVVDHGAGMSEETLQRIFEAFYTTKRNGTGLGMMITQEIIRKHGGKIEIESEEGLGTKVSVYLPA